MAKKPVKEDMQFEGFISLKYAKEKNFKKLKHNLNNIRATLLAEIPDFHLKPVQVQFEYCVTVGCIALQSQQDAVRKLRVFTPAKKEVLPYSIDRYYID